MAWRGNWTSFLDTMLQTSLLCTTARNLAVPIDIEKIIIDPVTFKKYLKEPEEGKKRKRATEHVFIYSSFEYVNKVNTL